MSDYSFWTGSPYDPTQANRDAIVQAILAQQDQGIGGQTSTGNTGDPGTGATGPGGTAGLGPQGWGGQNGFMTGAPAGSSMFGTGDRSSYDPGGQMTTSNAALLSDPSMSGMPNAGVIDLNAPSPGGTSLVSPGFGPTPAGGFGAQQGFVGQPPDTFAGRWGDFPTGVPTQQGNVIVTPTPQSMREAPAPTTSTPGIPGSGGGVSTAAGPGASPGGFGGGIDMTGTGGYEGSASVGNTTGAAGFTSPGGGSGFGNVGGQVGSYGAYAGEAPSGFSAPSGQGFSMTGGYDPGSFSAGYSAAMAEMGASPGTSGEAGGSSGSSGGATGSSGGSDPGASPGGVG